MTKHTPGPWFVNDMTLPASRIVGVGPATVKPIHRGKFYALCQLDKETQANVQLIAAAPELLEALQDLVKAHEIGMGAGAVNLRLDLARTAIAKAEGK